jgi:ferredoxin--NADP+ reductase
MRPRAAIVGAGPSGFYAADQLIRAGFEVDLLDRLPTPWGLVRAGVAPDHPNIKGVTRVYETTAAKPGFRFFGGVDVGRHVTRQDLLDHYHAVVYAYGTATDKRLGIPGENRPGSYAATEFVAWYNGHPDACDADFDLSVTRAVVIGNGNVAVDVARMLLLDSDELAVTDTADHAIDAFSTSRVAEAVLLGRRGPVQAAFTNPELLELGEMTGVEVDVDPDELELDPESARSLEEQADKTTRRNVEILREFAARSAGHSGRRISLRFLRSPVEILGDGEDGPVTGVRLAINRLERSANRGLRAVPTGQEEVMACGAVFRSIGYRGKPCDDVPFDDRRGLIHNDAGRVVLADGTSCVGEYAVGWIKRGPSGVIGTNKKDAKETTDKLIEDREARRLREPMNPTADAAVAMLADRVPRLVTWAGWQAIDASETSAGAPHGRPRVKLVRHDELYAVAGMELARG